MTETACLLFWPFLSSRLLILVSLWSHSLLIWWRILNLWPSLSLHWGFFIKLLVIIIIRLSSGRCPYCWFLGCTPTSASLSSVWVNVCNNCFFRNFSFGCSFLLRFNSSIFINFWEGGFNLFKLSWPKPIKLLSYWWAHHPIEFAHALVSDISHILKIILDTFEWELNASSNKLRIWNIIGLKDS